MAEDFYPFVDSGDPAPDNRHLTPNAPAEPNEAEATSAAPAPGVRFATRIAVYDDMLSTPRVIVVEQQDVRTYLEEITNTVYRTMREQGGHLSLMVIRELVENFIHAHFAEPVISILDEGNTVRFADQGPGIEDKERAFEFGVTSANREQKRYIRGTGAGLPMVQQYLENAGGAIAIEDNLHQGTVVTVSIDPARVTELAQSAARGAVVRMAGAGWEPSATAAQPSAGAPAMAAPYGAAAPAPAAGAPATTPYPAPWPAAYPAGYPATAAGRVPNPYPAAYPPGYPAQPWAPQPYPGAYPPGYPAGDGTAGWQPYPPQAGAPTAGGYPAPAAGAPHVTDRGRLALQYLAEHGSGGPTDLAAAFGESTPTWSRELAQLATTGFVIKQGQKRVLTDMGSAWIAQQAPQA